MIIPFGGGTNVTCALSCNTREQRMIVSLDVSQMVLFPHTLKKRIIIIFFKQFKLLELHTVAGQKQHGGLRGKWHNWTRFRGISIERGVDNRP